MKKLLKFIIVLGIIGWILYLWSNYMWINFSDLNLNILKSSKNTCPEDLEEKRLYHDNWSLKEKWCVNNVWNFEGLVNKYDEEWSLESEWSVNNDISYWLWNFYYNNWYL